MEFRKIDRSNYWDCISLKVDESQQHFVADNTSSLVEAAFEDGLYTLGIYHEDEMIGFVLYDYDETFPGWSMSRFMIGKQHQGKGYGKQAVIEFLDHFKEQHNADKIYISVSLDNTVAHKLYSSIGFRPCLKNGQHAQTADLFPPYCVDFPCNTQSIPASNRLVWRKNLSLPGTLPFIKQGLKK